VLPAELHKPWAARYLVKMITNCTFIIVTNYLPPAGATNSKQRNIRMMQQTQAAINYSQVLHTVKH